MKGFEALLSVQVQPRKPNQPGTSGAQSGLVLGAYDNGTKTDKNNNILKTIKFDFLNLKVKTLGLGFGNEINYFHIMLFLRIRSCIWLP